MDDSINRYLRLLTAAFVFVTASINNSYGQPAARGITASDWTKRLETIRNGQAGCNATTQESTIAVGAALYNWTRAAKAQYGDEQGKALGSPSFLLKMESVWKDGRIQMPLVNKGLSRLKFVPLKEIEKWKEAVTPLDSETKGSTVLGYLVFNDRLFDSKGLKASEVERLSKRLPSLSPEDVETVANAAGISKSRAAMELIQCDAFFKDDQFDKAGIEAALKQLPPAKATP